MKLSRLATLHIADLKPSPRIALNSSCSNLTEPVKKNSLRSDISDMFTILGSLYLICALAISVIAKGGQAIEYKNVTIVRERFACIRLETSALFDEDKGSIDENAERVAVKRMQNQSASSVFMVMPVGEAELPTNWDHTISDDQKLIIIYGYPSENDDLLEIDIVRYGLGSPEPGLAGIRITLEDGNDIKTNNFSAWTSKQEVELAFHRISLTEFLLHDYWKSVDNIFSSLLWPQSRLVGVEAHRKHGSLVRVWISADHVKAIERLRIEVERATGAGNHRKLCQFRKSKTISIEHFFRSVGLYPNWCTFKLTERD